MKYSFNKSFMIVLTILALTFSSLGVTPAQAADGDYAWAKQMGGLSPDSGFAIDVDGSGNVYTTGVFRGTVDFDPGAGTANLTSAGDADIFVSKLDANGGFVWAKQMGGLLSDYGYAIAVDGSGNVYTTGYFQGTADFDPGAGAANLTSAGSDEIFVSKLDTNGNFVWAKQMGGLSSDSGSAIDVDGSGNVHTTGYFQGTADFDPGAGTANLTSAGSDEIFVSKLDTNGNFVWAKQMGGLSSDSGSAIDVDGSGIVHTTGYFQGTADFDPGAGTANLTSAGSDEIFVSKLDTNGNFVWAKQMGGLSWEYGFAIAVDGNGNVYTTGSFHGTADFDPGAGAANLTSAGGEEIFVSKLDVSGNFVWAKQMGGLWDEYGNAIDVDGSGNVYTTGDFQGTVDFDPGAGAANLTSAGFSDIFVSKLDASGDFVWAKQMGGESNDYGWAIDVDGGGNVYTTGLFRGTVDFDPGAGTANLISAGDADIFVSKLIKSPTFADVPSNHWAWQYIESLYNAGITGGCGNGNFCPNNSVTRAQMAIFLLRGIHGSAYTPPPATGTMFTDVPASLSTASWIEQLANEGITSGCGGGKYCPNNSVTRAQMAIFLLRAKYGSGYTPPPATGTMFTDVPASLSTAAWIEQLANEGITSGCGGGNYCPNNPVTRASMAVFLVRAFNLP